MNRYAFLLCMIFLQPLAFAQSFTPKDTLEFNNLSNPVYEWIDVNNDGRLDILITGQDQSITDVSTSLSFVYEQQADTTFVLQATDLQSLGQQQFRIADLNGDGRQDLLMSSTDGTSFEHAILENNGDYTWTKVVINTGITHWEELRLADLDNDGQPEIITASEEGLEAYKEVNTVWEIITLPEEVLPLITDPVIADFDKDGFKDILLMGEVAEGEPVAWWLINQQELEFKIQTVGSDSLRIVDYVVSDFNEDGFPDVFFSTEADSRTRATQMLLNVNGEAFTDSVNNDRLGLKNARVFAADITSDGIVETDIEGEAPGVTNPIVSRERVIHLGGGLLEYERDTLENTAGQGRRYGDYDFDGDLDYFEITVVGTEGRVWLYENTEEEMNEGPDGLEDLLAFQFQDALYLVWNKASDDRTDSRSVTYDVSLGTAEGTADIMAGGFDPSSLRRTVVGPGNQGYNDFLILKNPPQAALNVNIMPIDNAFHYNVSECLQGQSSPCNEEIPIEEILLCGESFIQLETETGEIARWFSFEGGYLGTSASLGVNVTGDDFVIAVYDRTGGCVDGEVFGIKYDAGLPALPDVEVCDGEEVNVTVAGVWESIEWTSAAQGPLSTTNEITYTPEANDEVTINATSLRGCTFEMTFDVTVADSTGTVNGTQFEIGEGESVRLEAGGGNEYLWLPATGLSNNQIANPLASPESTTEYTVLITTGLGCTSEIKVLVEVVLTSFAPDAFSPNGDGRNERFRVYDLEGPVDFTFSIFDRAGNRVFQTSTLSEATVSGWDGTNNGNPVPAGTYFWRVTGTYADGQKILINGETKGALQLIR